MAISFIGVSTVANGLATGPTATLATPVGTADGDLMIAHIVIRDEAQTITPPAGWTQIPVAVSETDHEMRWYQHTAASEPANRSWTLGGSTSYTGILTVYRDAVNPHGSSTNDGIAVLAHSTNNVTTLGAGAWLLGGWSGQSILALGWAPPGAMTERADVIGGLLLLLNASGMVATQGPVAVGTYSRTATSVDLIAAISSLLAIEATIDPLVATPLDFKQIIPAPTITPGEVVLTFDGLTTSEAFGPAAFLSLGLMAVPLDLKALLDTPTITPGEVVLESTPIFTSLNFGTEQEIMMGFLLSNSTPLITSQQVLAPVAGQFIGTFIAPRTSSEMNQAILPSGFVFNAASGAQGPCCSQ